jgi:thiol:disulfide interchange protein DsbD
LLLRRYLFAFFLQCLLAGTAWPINGLPFQSKDEFLDAADVFTISAAQEDGSGFLVQGHIADAHYLYRHALRLVDADGNEVPLALPDGMPRHDEFFGDTEVYLGDTLHLRFASNTKAPLTLHWQGCADAGICYPPQTMAVSLPPTDGGEDQIAAQRLDALGPVSGALLFLGFGLLLAFTPCTLPMIPIVSSMVIGSHAPPRRALMLSFVYVLAMASTYAAVGVVAGLAGANVQAALQSPWLLGSFAGLFLLLAASLFGLFELRLPSALVNRLNSAGQHRAGGSLTAAALLGFISAILVGPCMTAPLAGALLYIGQTGSALTGGVALFALGLGMGLPLVAIAVFGSRILPRPGAWMERVRVAFGFVMAGMAVLMLSRFLAPTLSLLLWGVWTLSVAVGLAALAQAIAQRLRLAWAVRFGSMLIGIWAALILAGGASGGSSPLQPLEHLRLADSAEPRAKGNYVSAKSAEDVDARIAEASARGQWTMIDFYADWCVSCHVIERNVFGDPSVSSRMAAMQVLRPDVTRNDATDKALMKRWQVLGPPTIILIGPDGSERRAQRTVGEVDAQEFLARLDTAGVQ